MNKQHLGARTDSAVRVFFLSYTLAENETLLDKHGKCFIHL